MRSLLQESLIFPHVFKLRLGRATGGADVRQTLSINLQVLATLKAPPDQLQIREVGAAIKCIVFHNMTTLPHARPIAGEAC